MNDAILVFTFSPVQQFITEARRAADLFTGSRILVELARAAGEVIGEDRLIYPRSLDSDVPNKLVARVPAEKAKTIAENAREALLAKWCEIADEARNKLRSSGPTPDQVWEAIWRRQIENLWEIYWAAAPMEGRSYKDAYNEASRVLDGLKRTRNFEASEEDGLKDTLSGRRSALRTGSGDARSYWRSLSQNVSAARLRPDGRERLDAIGAIKRFCRIADRRFPSTSTVASADFLERARDHLAEYRAAVEDLLDGHLCAVRDTDEYWPYDGDLLYTETLAQKRLGDSYGAMQIDEEKLSEAQKKLTDIYRDLELRPSPYYAVIVLDGDKMGERIGELLDKDDPIEEHRNFSGKLAEFARSVPDLIENNEWLIYNGGDDVLLLSPLAKAVPLARKLAQKFQETTRGTASAGIAIVHHLYPLDAALSAARRAEGEAKRVRERNAVCVYVLKRSGGEVHMGSKWDDLGERFDCFVDRFQKKELSSKFAYELLDEARIVTGLEDRGSRSAALRRLLKRHKTRLLSAEGESILLDEMRQWADALDETTPFENDAPQGFAELGRWLVLARFVAQGGAE